MIKEKRKDIIYFYFGEIKDHIISYHLSDKLDIICVEHKKKEKYLQILIHPS